MIKKMFNFSFIAALLIFMLAGCATTTEVRAMPEWVNYPKKVYSEGDYKVYVGYGNDRNAAEISALNGLSSIFEQAIQSSTTTSNRLSEAKAEGFVADSFDRDFDQKILKEVNVDELIGIEIADYWFDSVDRWYAIAVLDKKQAISLYKTMIQKNSDAIETIIDSTKSDVYSLQSYCAYDFAQEIAEENKKYLNRLYVLDYDVADSMKEYAVTPEKIAEKKLKIAKSIPIAINIKGDADGKFTSTFLEAFKKYNFIGSLNSNARYVVNGDVSFERENTSDGKTTKCVYDLETVINDTKKGVQIFPVNIRGRQAHVSYEKAKLRAENDIIAGIKNEFDKNIMGFLSSYSEK